MLTEGRLRHFSFPHALEDLNGVVTFNASGIRLDDPGYTTPLNGKLGGGAVKFGGRIGLVGYELSEFDVTATGDDMRLRFPEGMRSVVDATLALQGPATAPVLSGTVTVEHASWTRGFDTSANVFSLGAGDETGLPGAGPATSAATLPLRYDVRIVAPSTLRIENDQARIVASSELNLRGTFDRPLLFGRAEIERGDVRFEGRRYQVTRGSLDFTNPNRIQPFFDIEAETRVRVPGQTYRVTLRMAGTTERHAAGVHVRSAAGADRHPDAALQRHGADRRHRAGLAAAAQPARAGHAAGARDAGADRRAVGRGRPGRAETRSASTRSRSRRC